MRLTNIEGRETLYSGQEDDEAHFGGARYLARLACSPASTPFYKSPSAQDFGANYWDKCQDEPRAFYNEIQGSGNGSAISIVKRCIIYECCGHLIYDPLLYASHLRNISIVQALRLKMQIYFTLHHQSWYLNSWARSSPNKASKATASHEASLVVITAFPCPKKSSSTSQAKRYIPPPSQKLRISFVSASSSSNSDRHNHHNHHSE